MLSYKLVIEKGRRILALGFWVREMKYGLNLLLQEYSYLSTLSKNKKDCSGKNHKYIAYNSSV